MGKAFSSHSPSLYIRELLSYNAEAIRMTSKHLRCILSAVSSRSEKEPNSNSEVEVKSAHEPSGP